jgi:hypothetical protein
MRVIQHRVKPGPDPHHLQNLATEIFRLTQNIPSAGKPHCKTTPGANQPYGIPLEIAKWAAETYGLDTERCTRPGCAALIKSLVPTFWLSKTEEHTHLSKIGILEDMNPEHWYTHPSLIMLTVPNKEDTMLK